MDLRKNLINFLPWATEKDIGMGKIQKVLEPLASDLVECKCLKDLVIFLEGRKVLKNSDRKQFEAANTDWEILKTLMVVLKKKDESALKAMEEFLMSNGNYAALRVKFAESWINEKNRRRIIKRAIGDSMIFLCSVQPA